MILLILVFPIKIINSFLFVLIFLTYFIFFGKRIFRNINLILLINFVTFFVISNFDYCLFLLNKYRFGFFEEANISLRFYQDITFDLSFFKILFLDLLRFIISPIPNITSLIDVISIFRKYFHV